MPSHLINLYSTDQESTLLILAEIKKWQSDLFFLNPTYLLKEIV